MEIYPSPDKSNSIENLDAENKAEDEEENYSDEGFSQFDED